MKIDYNILWFEDDPEWISPREELLKEYLEEKGFSLNITPYSKYIDDDFEKYDIIAIDYNLEDKEKGDVIINKIRQHKIFTEILFYSQDGEKKIRDIISSKQCDGVYCSSRTNLTDKLKVLIYNTIRKTQDINNLRGLVMTETSNLDNLIENILLDFFKSENKNKGNLRNYILDRITKSLKDNFDNEMTLKISSKPDKEIIESRVFDASKKARAINKLIKIESLNTKDKKLNNFFEDYKEEVLEVRNLLAHNPEENGSSSIMKIKNEKGEIIEFDENKFSEIRKKLQENKNKFLIIRSLLSI